MKDINCKFCGRYLFKQAGTVVIEEVPCPGCKAKLNFKLISADQTADITHKFIHLEQPPKAKKQVEVS
jgi:phage FluMu protein Com